MDVSDISYISVSELFLGNTTRLKKNHTFVFASETTNYLGNV